MNGRTTPASHAAIAAAEKGILVVAANGNYAAQSWHYLGTPADADSILSVGATDYLGNWASFSSVGPSSDGMVKPDVADMGLSSSIVDPNSGNIIQGSGTSFATPTLAGAAACFWQAHPTMTNMQIRAAIIESANQYTHPDTLEGYGVPNFELANTIITNQNSAKINQNISVLVYPNPFNNSVTIIINGDVSSGSTFAVYDLLGQRIKSIAVGNNKIIKLYKEQLASGMYFYKLLTNQGETLSNGKFIIE
jgi:subtilisin family serine protease